MDESDMERHAGREQVAENIRLAPKGSHESALKFESRYMAH